MAITLENIFYDSLSFTTATNLWTDAALTSLAPDGWYSEVGIFRRKNLGVLGPVQTCPECIPACGSTINGSGDQGTFSLDFSVGTGIGAVIVKFYPANIPDKATWTYDGVSASEYSSRTEGYLEGVVGQIVAGGACGLQNNNGSNGATYAGTSHVWSTTTNTFIDTGVSVTMGPYTSAFLGGVTLTTFSPGQCFMVIPKPTAAPGSMNLLIEGPCGATGWDLEVYCPRQLDARTVGSKGGTCGTYNTDMYSCSVDGASDGSSPNLGINDWVFTDPNGVNKFEAGVFPTLIAGTEACITVSTDGIITAITTCSGSCV